MLVMSVLHTIPRYPGVEQSVLFNGVRSLLIG